MTDEDTKVKRKIKSLIETRFELIKDDICYVMMNTELDFLTTEFIAYNKKDYSGYYNYINDTFKKSFIQYLSQKSLDITLCKVSIKPFTEEIDRYVKKFITKDEKTQHQKFKEVMDVFDYSFLHMLDKDTQLDRYTKMKLFRYILDKLYK